MSWIIFKGCCLNLRVVTLRRWYPPLHPGQATRVHHLHPDGRVVVGHCAVLLRRPEAPSRVARAELVVCQQNTRCQSEAFALHLPAMSYMSCWWSLCEVPWRKVLRTADASSCNLPVLPEVYLNRNILDSGLNRLLQRRLGSLCLSLLQIARNTYK